MESVYPPARPVLATGQTRIVIIWKVIEYVSLVLFAVIVPRAMGPDMYGRFAALLAFITLLTIITGLGALPTFGRFVPEYQLHGEDAKTRILFSQIFLVRVLILVFLGLVFLVFLPRLLPEASPFTVTAGATTLIFGALAATCYQLFHGLNILGKWLSQDSLLKLVLLIYLLILGGMGDMDRAALALLLTQVGFLLLGLFWARSYFTFSKSVLDISFLYQHLRFGLLLFSGNLLLMAVWRTGEVVILLLSGESTEVAFFNIANLIAVAITSLIGQLSVIITPSLTTLHISQDNKRVDAWLGYSLKYLTIISFAFLFAVHTLGAWGVNLVWGAAYLPVVANLKILALGLLALPLVRTGISLAILHRQPGKVFRVTTGALIAFLLPITFLVPSTGSYGASIAVALALWTAGLISHFQFSLASALAVAHYWRHIIIGFIALATLTLSVASSVLMGSLATALYILLLFWGGVISGTEVRQRIGQILAT